MQRRCIKYILYESPGPESGARISSENSYAETLSSIAAFSITPEVTLKKGGEGSPQELLAPPPSPYLGGGGTPPFRRLPPLSSHPPQGGGHLHGGFFPPPS
uniref:Uncharacterized protein n=1 Tax=Chromera velia CCMP2878 TaxID=1169474 RepID=A0A0G4HXT4_9ALVE|eukprot:Cvel_33297.t1-p1 / transcript=Cvel_33297.t1 / gene=Cvel_33297 / organism=Chromera_velia_CCMP2878 / gene_product=hypothetical protein / transcript_product=hypothetical protein / location=Cvel_scaffold5369:3161-3460(-) / protein_length=100 / sequence_SO=supercontig / SO=protein_coding / is_pseudo=false